MPLGSGYLNLLDAHTLRCTKMKILEFLSTSSDDRFIAEAFGEETAQIIAESNRISAINARRMAALRQEARDIEMLEEALRLKKKADRVARKWRQYHSRRQR